MIFCEEIEEVTIDDKIINKRKIFLFMTVLNITYALHNKPTSTHETP